MYLGMYVCVCMYVSYVSIQIAHACNGNQLYQAM